MAKSVTKPKTARPATPSGPASSSELNGHSSKTSPPKNGKVFHKTKKKSSGLGFRPATYFLITSAVAALAVGGFFLYSFLEERKTLSPYPSPLIPLDRSYVNSLLWGTYRPGLYFGLKSRTPNSLEVGLIWFSYSSQQISLKHLCDQNDGVYYGWISHDGRSFGYQEIHHDQWNISTSFVKKNPEQSTSWTAQLGVNSKVTQNTVNTAGVGLFLYFRLEDQGSLSPVMANGDFSGIEGTTPNLGNFKIKLSPTGNFASSSFLAANSPSVVSIKDTVISGLTMDGEKGLKLVGQVATTPNVIVYEVTAESGFNLDVVYESVKDPSSAGGKREKGSSEPGSIGELIDKRKQAFKDKFSKVFRMREKGYGEQEEAFAQRTMSNLLGGIGYFYGESLVDSKWQSEPAKYWKTGLFTAVPSRSFFPRGFLWDEGFHHLLISRWDIGLTREIMTSWLNLMNSRGWIPREQILGEEARSRVPAEFIVQNSDYANPPSFFLTIESLLDNLDPDRPDEIDKTLKFFEFALPRLQAWYNWFNTTQIGPIPGTYRWRGRNETTDREINPKTLTSGLDDYPRASHPGPEERHVDLYCWMAYAAGILARVTEEIGESSKAYRETEQYLKNNVLLDEMHWSNDLQAYADYGRHTNAVRLVARPPEPGSRPGGPQLPKVRFVEKDPSLQYVDAFGYVSLFPLMLRILEPSSPKLGVLLDKIRDPNLLWTEFGIRSLAKNSPLFMKHNTEHDAPYWRGPIWINMNYLTWKALKHYGSVRGPFQQKAANLANELRRNVVANMFRQFTQNGYVWEQYVDQSGEGKGSHPFTGWSSLVVLMMADF